MVGFVKELMDEQGASGITLGRNEQIRRSKFERLLVTPGVIFVSKLAPTLDAFPNPVLTGEGRGNDDFMEWRRCEDLCLPERL